MNPVSDQKFPDEILTTAEKDSVGGGEVEKRSFLRKIDLFKTVPDRTLDLLIKQCKVIGLEDEEVLIEEGTVGKKMWVILEGELLVYKLKKTIAITRAGDFLGEMSLIDNKPRSASIRSIGPSRVMEIDGLVFKDVILVEPEAVVSVLSCLTSRLRNNLNIIASENQHLNCLVHDMRNYLVPLSISEAHIVNILNKLSGTEVGHTKRNGWDELDSGLRKMISVRNNVLTLIDQTLSTSIRKKSDYVKSSASIVELVLETVEEISYHKNVKGKKLNTHTPDEQIDPFDFNTLDIKRVLQNLIINAGYASEKGGLIEVKIIPREKAIQVYVADHGMGIPDDVKPLLLKEKYTSKPDGNGFGLLSCREIIVGYHHGEFGFESELGKGTTFYFTLPRCTPPNESGTSP